MSASTATGQTTNRGSNAVGRRICPGANGFGSPTNPAPESDARRAVPIGRGTVRAGGPTANPLVTAEKRRAVRVFGTVNPPLLPDCPVGRPWSGGAA